MELKAIKYQRGSLELLELKLPNDFVQDKVSTYEGAFDYQVEAWHMKI